jgi:hypothetical protein
VDSPARTRQPTRNQGGRRPVRQIITSTSFFIDGSVVLLLTVINPSLTADMQLASMALLVQSFRMAPVT